MTGETINTEKAYTDAARLVSAVSAIEHLVEGASFDVKRAYEDLAEAASTEEALHRDRNLCENEWAYNILPSALIHPDHTDPRKRRQMIVGMINPEEADIDIETIGPFPMGIEDYHGEIITIEDEDELYDYFRQQYNGQVTTIWPMPYALSPHDYEQEHQR